MPFSQSGILSEACSKNLNYTDLFPKISYIILLVCFGKPSFKLATRYRISALLVDLSALTFLIVLY
jgi:hypothetical protein